MTMTAGHTSTPEGSAENAAPELDFPHKNIEKRPPRVCPQEPPDGGFQAWVSVFGCFLVYFCTLGLINAFGEFNVFYTNDYLSNYPAALISMIGALQVFVLYLLGAWVGPLFDAYGPRYLIPCSGIVVVFALCMLSITQPHHIWQQYLTQAVLLNGAAAFSFYPSMAVIGHWFKRRTAYALGFVVAGSGISGIVFPIMISRLLPKVGFAWTVRVCALLVFVCYGVATFTIKTYRPTKPLPDSVLKILDVAAFRDLRFTFFTIGAWLSMFSVFNPYFYIAEYSTAMHGSEGLSAYLLAILCAVSVPGRILPGLFADKWGRFNTIIISTALSGLLILSLWYTSTAPENNLAFGILYGFVSGPIFTLLPGCVASISPIEKIGARIGILFAVLSTGALAGSPIGGIFVKSKDRISFERLILYTGIMALAGSFFFVLARLQCNRKLWAAV
ncbi:major facilitator superfamily domain-containing protein [Hygrophoropsis aurantiaca]|uniref:Major facilitator superfamily domain-containing protein n=1 Tax=Hygrophoropsis aurantiaca TaxID=72124 RepID=A0ACB8AHK3_9AGAM|nr:major facilitator superfamily domain-containing protein [Hygrophoropsis aurantiaca]